VNKSQYLRTGPSELATEVPEFVNELSKLANELSEFTNELSELANEVSDLTNELSEFANELSELMNELFEFVHGSPSQVLRLSGSEHLSLKANAETAAVSA